MSIKSRAPAEAALRDYLVARNLDPALADGEVGRRFAALRANADAATPSDVFGRWYAAILGGLPAEAESVGWVAFHVADAAGHDLLGDVTAEQIVRLRRAAPLPATQAPLTMPAQALVRPSHRGRRPWRSRTVAGGHAA